MDGSAAEFPVLVEHVDKTFPTAFGYAAWIKHRGRPPRRPALSDVSFAVRRGELFGLLGANGAGKSTILRLLSGLVIPDRGRVVVNGVDAVREPLRMRGQIGLCTGEERSFYFRLTARANLDYFAALAGVPDAQRRARIEDVARTVDLEADLDRRFDRFSAGMRQRLAIARALLGDAQILLFDEPTRAVDPVHARDLRRLARDLVERRGKTIVLATNLLEEAWELCDRIAILRAGEIVTVAAPSELRAPGSTGRRYAIHVDRLDDALLERMNVVPGVVAVATEIDGERVRLSVELDEHPRTLTELLRAVSANGVSISEVRPDGNRPFDLFAALTGAPSDGR
jgi:ABC-2 type transport system ATP-binding protein